MTFTFYLFAIMAIIASIGVVGLKNPVHCALSLVLALFGTAGIYILQNAEFLAALEIIIYAGAIMVLFLFVLMCLNIRELKAMPQFNKLKPIAVVLGTYLTALLIVVIVKGYNGGGIGQIVGKYSGEKMVQLGGNTNVFGQVLYSRYLLPFEVISIVLLVAMIGAIVLMIENPRKKRK